MRILYTPLLFEQKQTFSPACFLSSRSFDSKCVTASLSEEQIGTNAIFICPKLLFRKSSALYCWKKGCVVERILPTVFEVLWAWTNANSEHTLTSLLSFNISSSRMASCVRSERKVRTWVSSKFSLNSLAQYQIKRAKFCALRFWDFAHGFWQHFETFCGEPHDTTKMPMKAKSNDHATNGCECFLFFLEWLLAFPLYLPEACWLHRKISTPDRSHTSSVLQLQLCGSAWSDSLGTNS